MKDQSWEHAPSLLDNNPLLPPLPPSSLSLSLPPPLSPICISLSVLLPFPPPSLPPLPPPSLSLPPFTRREGVVVEDPSCEHHLCWIAPPDRVLVIKKFKDTTVTEKFKEITTWLVQVFHHIIYFYPRFG